MNKKHILEELQELNAEKLLTHLEASQDISSDYFENLSNDFLARLPQEEISAQRKKVIIRNIFLSVSLAAALLILLAIPFFNKTNNLDWSQVSASDLENYIENNIEDFSDEEIASISSFSDNSIFLNSDFSDEILEDYLFDMEVEETLF